MIKKSVFLSLALTGIFHVSASAWWWSKPEITMLVVPRNAECIRIAQDMAHRYPVLLVTYRTVGNETEIHAWNGTSWVAVPVEDYVSGAFFANRPSHAIIVDSETAPAPKVLIPDGTWCSSGNRLASTDPRVMIHLLGRYFNVSYNTWKDLTWRYHYPLRAINPGLINIPWWHFRGEDLYRQRMQRNLSADLDKWYRLDITPPAPVEPVELKEDVTDVPAVETPAEEPVTEEAVVIETEKPSEEADAVVETTTEKPAEAVPAEESTLTVEDVVTEKPVAVEEETSVVETADPFSEEEVPAAEVVEPAKEKKPWWKIF